ncbi:MAG TPA: Ig-like domain-containing protein, partial [Candidatus Nanoarchaeia archaeon]|nr:Ig-like domain-containing protein [Candidatus Nanoarchaeia archaeon]
NDTARFSIIAGTGLITNATFLPVGSFDLLLNATDASSRTNSTNITITIIDTIAPSWAPLPSDQVVEVGDAVSYDLNAADLATIAYSINDTARFIIDNGTGLISNSTFISAGNYSINASAIDPSSNVNSTSFIIEARDTRAPQVTNSNVPLSKRFNETFNITVDAYDFTSVANVSVEINGTNRSMTSLAGTTYYYTITNNSLVNDTFILRFHANDTFGNMNSSITATFTIVGPTNNIPSITSFTPSSGSFIYEGDQLNISAGAVDSDGTAPTIILYRNATALTNASANLSYEWLTSNQDAGIYNFTACASDGIDSSCQSNIYTVLNKALPNLSSVSPLGTVFTSRQNITITPDRPINASTVLLTLNGVPVNATASSSAISYFAQLPEGVNTLNATASDLFNNTESFDWSFTVDITGSLSGFVFFGGSGVTGANVSVYNESGIVSSSLTYATGEIITPFTLHEGNYSLNISANGYIRASSHFNMTGANRQINTSLSQEPDAMVHSINVSGNYLMEYQNITITSIVGYSGDIPRNSTIRLLYANNTEIMNSSIQFTNSSNQSVSLQWIAQTGTFDFKVAVDRAADEAYTANNAFFKYGVQARDVQNTLYSYFFVVSTTQSSNSNLSAYLSLENLATSALVDLPVTLSAETGLAIISSATQNVNLSAGEIKWISWSVNTTGYNTTLDDPDRLNASVFGEKIANISISNSQDGGGFGTSSVGENTGFEPESNSSISLNFNYGNHSGYDEDNDGSANLSEVVDFTLDALIAQSIDPATLCTLYRIYSEEDATLTSACYGAKQCCQFVGLAPYQNAWDSDFYLAYGLFGSTEHNLVEAKVISVDYDLRISYLYVDIDYSNPQTLEANFTEAALSQLNVTYEPTASHEPITSHDEESPAFTNETMPAGDNAENPESNNTQMGAS